MANEKQNAPRPRGEVPARTVTGTRPLTDASEARVQGHYYKGASGGPHPDRPAECAIALTRHIALIPAAGIGARVGAGKPKQYVDIHGVPVLVHTVRAFVACPTIDFVLVVLSPQDRWASGVEAAALARTAPGRLEFACVGGDSRAASFANGLAHLGARIADDDWVLVHDAARPCIRSGAIGRLIDTLAQDPHGGLLALPVADTVKRGDAAGRVAQTVPREGLWLAQTPQMFRAALLSRAYAAHPGATDEAGAVEALGFAPRLVVGDADNFKVTYPDDIARAERVLAASRTAAAGD